MKFVVIDTETGGIDPRHESLISVAAVLVDDLNIVAKREWFVLEDPLVIRQGAWNTNRIDLADYFSKAVPPVQVVSEFESFVSEWRTEKGRAVPAGHNVEFDVRFLGRLGWLANDQRFADRLFTYHRLDSHSLMRALHVAGLVTELPTSLKHCCDYFGINIEGAHSALPDAIATAELIAQAVSLMRRDREEVDVGGIFD